LEDLSSSEEGEPEQPEITSGFQDLAGEEQNSDEAEEPLGDDADGSAQEGGLTGSEQPDDFDIESLEVPEDELESIPGDETPPDDALAVEDEDSEEELPELEVDEEDDSAEPYSGDELERSLSSGGEQPQGQEEDSLEDITMDLEDEPFDDVGAVQEEFSAPQESHGQSGGGDNAQAGGEGQEDSSAVLSTIEQELASIKSELNDLREELASLRSHQPQEERSAEREQSAASDDHGEDEDEVGPGFFEEDEDETIALTGDELDNILSTAEFTEETGKPTEYEEELELDSGYDQSQEEGTDWGDLSDLDEETEDSQPFAEESAEQADTSPQSSDEVLGGDELLSDQEDILPMQAEVSEEEQPAATKGESSEESIDWDDQFTPESPDEIELEELSGDDQPAVRDESAEDQESAESEGAYPFGGADEDLEALADMDIDSELAGIDELSDEPAGTETDESETAPSTDAEPAGDTGSQEEEEELEPLDIEVEPASNQDWGQEDRGWSKPEQREPAEPQQSAGSASHESMPEDLRSEIRSVLSYMDQLLESLPEEKIQEFANSEYFDTYRRLFEELGLER
jgi:hypothetical protein